MKYLYSKMVEAGFTQQELCDKLGVSRTTINNMEHTDGYVASDKLNKSLSDIFNCDVIDLYSVEELLKIKVDKETFINKVKEEYEN